MHIFKGTYIFSFSLQAEEVIPKHISPAKLQ